MRFQRRVCFWGGISWWSKTPDIAEDSKVLFRHTKNICVDTLFEDKGVVYRVVQTRGASENDNVSYVDHSRFPNSIPTSMSYTTTRWKNDTTKAELQDTIKTLHIYTEALYPTLTRLGIKHIVEDNASSHNNDRIRQSRTVDGVEIVG